MPRERLETRVLGWLEHPTNLVIANVAWFVLVLPLVTWLPATVAVTHALDRWSSDADDRVLRNVVAGWRRHWRRTLPVGAASTAVAAVFAVNALFLSTRPPGIATVFLGGTGALGLAWLALHLWLVPVVAHHPDLPVSRWFAESAALAVAHPLLTLGMVTFGVLLVAVLAGFWTFLPFLSGGLVAALSLRAYHLATRA